MAHTITFEVTDSEYLSMEYAAVDVNEWADNAVTARAFKAGNQIIDLLVKYCNANNVQLAVGRDAQIQQAFDLGVVTKAADRVTPSSTDAA